MNAQRSIVPSLLRHNTPYPAVRVAMFLETNGLRTVTFLCCCGPQSHSIKFLRRGKAFLRGSSAKSIKGRAVGEPVVTENSVRTESARVPSIREILVRSR